MSDTLSNEEDLSGDDLTGKDDPTTWVSHPIDIRLSVPFIAARFYFTIVAGREKRRPDRRLDDRGDYPLMTLGNALFGLGVTTLFMLIALTLLIMRSSIIEY